MRQKITPFLWFNDNAEEAMDFYVKTFKNSGTLSVHRYGEGGPGPAGSVMVANFRLGDQEFTALNGGPMFTFTEAISFLIDCADQEEVDYFWDTLSSDGGQTSQCGWLKDKFGLSWQVVPKQMGELLSDPDPAKSGRVMQAMMQMTKIEIAKLQEAYDQA